MIDDVTGHRDPTRAEQLINLGELQISSQRDGGAHTLLLAGELDLATTDDVERELQRVEASDADAIILDLSGLTFISSTGVRLLLSAEARSRVDARRLSLRRGPPSIQRVLELSGVTELLPFND